MTDVLNQDEINALLASVGSDAPPQGAPAQPVMRPKAQPAFVNVETTTYDFQRPERVSKDHIRALASIHEVFARNFGATLSGFLRTIIDVRVVGVEQLTYNEFIHSLPNLTCFQILQAPPLEGQMCLEMSPLIVYPIIDRLLGGSSTDTFIPQRPLTSIEWRLIGRLVDRALDHLSEVWRNLVDARFEVVETESNPQLVHIVAPTEVVVFITFEIKLSQFAGTMSLCIPFNVIESVLSRLTTQSWFYRPKPASPTQTQRVMRNLAKSPVNMTVFLGESTVRLNDLRNMQPGDLLELDKRACEALVLQIEGRNKFRCRAGQVRGHRAVRLERIAQIDEKL